MLLLAIIAAIGCIRIKMCNVPIVFGPAQFEIFVFYGLIISGVIIRLLRRRAKAIALACKNTTKKNVYDQDENKSVIFEITGVLNNLASVSSFLYWIFACIFMLSIPLYAEYAPANITLTATPVIVTSITLLRGCYITVQRKIKEALIIMMYIESFVINVTLIICLALYIFFFASGLIFILLCLFIMAFFWSTFGGQKRLFFRAFL